MTIPTPRLREVEQLSQYHTRSQAAKLAFESRQPDCCDSEHKMQSCLLKTMA